MALTLSELRTRVKQATGRTGTAVPNQDALIAQYLNDALRVTARYANWRDLAVNRTATLAVGTTRYAFPTDLKQLVSMRLKDGTGSALMTEISGRALDAAAPDLATEGVGVPTCYAVDGNYFEIYPPTDAAYGLAIRGFKFPPEMVVDSDNPAVDGIDDVLIHFATADLFASMGMLAEAEYFRAKGKDALAAAAAEDARRPAWYPEEPVAGELPVSNYWGNPFVRG